MARLFVTGDIHGSYSIQPLITFHNRMKDVLTKEDKVIILGDVAVYGDGDTRVQHILNRMCFSVCGVDGNHENHDMIDKETVIYDSVLNGNIGIIEDTSIYHLRRGETYNINNKSFFVFGGGLSIDKHYRIPGKTWWEQEIPDGTEFHYGLDNLEMIDNKVDIVLSHTCPHNIVPIFTSSNQKFNDQTTHMLEKYMNQIKFNKGYFGHFHIDKTYGKFRCLYDDIIEIE